MVKTKTVPGDVYWNPYRGTLLLILKVEVIPTLPPVITYTELTNCEGLPETPWNIWKWYRRYFPFILVQKGLGENNVKR